MSIMEAVSREEISFKKSCSTNFLKFLLTIKRGFDFTCLTSLIQAIGQWSLKSSRRTPEDLKLCGLFVDIRSNNVDFPRFDGSGLVGANIS